MLDEVLIYQHPDRPWRYLARVVTKADPDRASITFGLVECPPEIFSDEPMRDYTIVTVEPQDAHTTLTALPSEMVPEFIGRIALLLAMEWDIEALEPSGLPQLASVLAVGKPPPVAPAQAKK